MKDGSKDQKIKRKKDMFSLIDENMQMGKTNCIKCERQYVVKVLDFTFEQGI